MTAALAEGRPDLRPCPEQLVAIARHAAASVARSATPPTAPPGERRHARIRCTDSHDVWIIVWGVGSGVELHDHGVSAGAFAVASGELTETSAGEDSTAPRTVRAGGERALAPGVLHAVRNEARAVAVSVHVYAPPLQTMGFFDGEHREVRREVVA